MIYSMTAFARDQKESRVGLLTCEIRSINHRFLELSIYLPEILRSADVAIRELIRKFINRGKVECNIRFHPTADNGALYAINKALAKELCQASEEIATYVKHSAPLNPTDILRLPGVLESQTPNVEELNAEVLKLIECTTQDLLKAREREGNELKKLFLQRLDLLEQEVAKVKQNYPAVLSEQSNRLQKRFKDAKVELDPQRLEQEMLLFAQRIDVTEEIERADTHIKEMRRILNAGGIVGRRLDFLLQELNREANTLGSKSVNAGITHAAVEMKVLIEQVREQVQNVE